ncbi:cyclophilin-like fold protein [Streptosporangium sp. NPDC006013]|uniref:cyclophilin-like fold protein n=1 Tax=Streptosporangium sp. NPDC006013 TaxID=3155596 RepID=UPI0033A61267
MPRLRFSTPDAEIIVTTTDNPTTQDLLAQLPLTLTFEDFAGKEKISTLPERLTTQGSQGSATRDGALIYYVPWGNIGFVYRADGKHDDDVITLGSIESGMDQMELLEQNPVHVDLHNP